MLELSNVELHAVTGGQMGDASLGGPGRGDPSGSAGSFGGGSGGLNQSSGSGAGGLRN